MSPSNSDAIARAMRYVQRKDLSLRERLGSGQDGIVLATDRKTAVKVFRHQELYEKEKYVYFRLGNEGIGSIAGFNVPRLIDRSDALLVIEMEIVKPPFVVDFAGATLDEPPAWLLENREEWEEHLRDLFEEEVRVSRVRELISAFRRLGVFLSDVKPGNVMFGDEHLRG